MSISETTELEIAQTIDDIHRIEDELGELALTLGSLEQWQVEQSNNILGKLRSHVRSELERGKTVLSNFQGFKKPEYPSEEERINARKDFHSKLLKRLNRNLFLGLFFALIPVFFGLLDSIGASGPISKLIYPALGLLILIPSIVVPLVLGSRRKKKGLPAKNTAKWIAVGVLIAPLIAFWPIIGFLAKFITGSSWFPALWQVILGATILMFITFIRAVLIYAKRLGDFEDDIKMAYSVLESRKGGAIKIRSSIKRLELLLQQLAEWDYIIGLYVRRPWIVKDKQLEAAAWEKDAAKLPKSIRFANALETSDGPVNPVRKTINEIVNRESSNGWRVVGFAKFISSATNFEEIPNALTWSGIDQDNPITPNGSLKRLRNLVESDQYLEMVGDSRVDSLVPAEQDRILAKAELEVKAVAPSKGQPEVTTWDEHLLHVVGNLRDGEPPLAPFAVKSAYSPEGITTNNIVSYVIGPERLVIELQKTYENRITKNTHLVASENTGNRHIDIVLRMDFAGLNPTEGSVASATTIDPDFVLWPGDSNGIAVDEPVAEQVKVCSNCGRTDCPGATSRAKCRETGI